MSFSLPEELPEELACDWLEASDWLATLCVLENFDRSINSSKIIRVGCFDSVSPRQKIPSPSDTYKK